MVSTNLQQYLFKKVYNIYSISVYRIDSTSDFRTEKYGTWTTSEGFKLSETVTQTTMVIRRKDLQGKSIAASYVVTDNSTRTKIHELL